MSLPTHCPHNFCKQTLQPRDVNLIRCICGYFRCWTEMHDKDKLASYEITIFEPNSRYKLSSGNLSPDSFVKPYTIVYDIMTQRMLFKMNEFTPIQNHIEVVKRIVKLEAFL